MGTLLDLYVIPLSEAIGVARGLIGGKAAALASLMRTGVRVPQGFCVTVHAYERFVQDCGLADTIRMELGRKPLESSRWEEIWDAALRIRTAFLNRPLPSPVTEAIRIAYSNLGRGGVLAVRSSAPGEDSLQRSFAGLHESVLGVRSEEALHNAIRVVWASLWSDAALLYRKELQLDPSASRMAVLVQEVVTAERSGVAFGRDPRDQAVDREIIEAVPGPCSDLVDGLVDPDRWVLRKSSGEIMEWRGGEREQAESNSPLLRQQEIKEIHKLLGRVENYLGWPPDVEWTGCASDLTLLQARPITSGLSAGESDQRQWYLSLRPVFKRLRRLADRVTKELIPALESLGRKFAAEDLESLPDRLLASSIEERSAELTHWRKVYEQEFIPFAHGVRYLGAYYNDAVQPKDPYEFLELVRGQELLAGRRNQALRELSDNLRSNSELQDLLERYAARDEGATLTEDSAHLGKVPGGKAFAQSFNRFLAEHMDTCYAGERLSERPGLIITIVLELARAEEMSVSQPTGSRADAIEQRLFEAAGEARQDEAAEVIDIGRLSWRLRDDDNLLLGCLESQLLRALHVAGRRLSEAGRLTGAVPGEKDATLIIQALHGQTMQPVNIVGEELAPSPQEQVDRQAARQLQGQPAAPGIASGSARVINKAESFAHFRAGEVLVCEAIQPSLTHLVPLASAIVEQRGGMLIHGAIIARELGIPCVNGIMHATSLLRDGEFVTVDGHLGLVSVGKPDFELETRSFRPRVGGSA